MRLTTHVLSSCPSYINTLGDRTLSLRSLDIPLLEQTDSLADIYTTLDLSHNDLRSIGSGLPVLLKVRSVLAASNRIASVSPQLSTTLPALKTLSLIKNAISDFQSLKELEKCGRLKNLYLIDNPVSQKDHYREFVVWLCPSLEVLDFEKVSKKERERSTELFGSKDEPTALAQQLLSISERSETSQTEKIQLTDEEKAKLKEQLKKATSLVEIDRIETALRTGFLP
ncbi:CYFA0S04e02476g1_1 [Cyberlindnera fabianii]|uniref:U2 small nuclear ribonucleoprotein A' n=1 Tax=Cyberlindnera fabianii TaxID=36022 RepID=A0A061AZ94_CYBFA|nr:CYFA0S04e02476g1_1 [Cyberlindnera fabianii]